MESSWAPSSKLAKLFNELLEVVILLGNFCKHFQALLHKVQQDRPEK